MNKSEAIIVAHCIGKEYRKHPQPIDQDIREALISAMAYIIDSGVFGGVVHPRVLWEHVGVFEPLPLPGVSATSGSQGSRKRS